MKMEQTELSEMSAYKIQTPGNYPEENTQRNKMFVPESAANMQCTSPILSSVVRLALQYFSTLLH
jgi:hypothetical protein